MYCLQALQQQSQSLTAEAQHLSQQLQMLQRDVHDKQQLHKHTRYIKKFLNCFILVGVIQQLSLRCRIAGIFMQPTSKSSKWLWMNSQVTAILVPKLQQGQFSGCIWIPSATRWFYTERF